jgi:hypothetical protein
MTTYSYIYIIYEHTCGRKETSERQETAGKWPIKYALRVYGGTSERVNNIIKYQYKGMRALYYYRYDSNDLYITNTMFTKYPRHKCRGLRSKCATLCNKGFITYLKTNLDFLLHIITVEIDYHFGAKLCLSAEYISEFEKYMRDPRAYFAPLIDSKPTSYPGVKFHEYKLRQYVRSGDRRLRCRT